MIIHNQSSCFLSLLQLVRFHIAIDVNFLITDPPPPEHPIERVLRSDIYPPNEIDAAFSDLPLDKLMLCVFDKALILINLFVELALG